MASRREHGTGSLADTPPTVRRRIILAIRFNLDDCAPGDVAVVRGHKPPPQQERGYLEGRAKEKLSEIGGARHGIDDDAAHRG